MKNLRNFIVTILAILIGTVNIFGTEAEVPMEKLAVVADGAILMDYATGRVLWSKNPTKPLSNASTTKIMTAMIVLENADLSDTVIVSKNASKAPEVKLFLKENEEVKLEDLMYALMLESSNDAAVAIAEHVAGTVEEFCKMMTDKAKELGCTDTIFETPNGLDKGEHHSTALDMAIITRYALGNEEFIKITNTKERSFSSNLKSYQLNNKNKLLSTYEGGNGVKTGFTNKAGQCFVGAAKRDDMQLISVVLASGWGTSGKNQKWVDTKILLDYGFENYNYETIITKGDVAGQINVEKTKTPTIDLVYEKGLMLPLREDEKNSIEITSKYEKNYLAPVEKNINLGKATVKINGVVESEINLMTNNFAQRHDFKTKFDLILNYWLNLA